MADMATDTTTPETSVADTMQAQIAAIAGNAEYRLGDEVVLSEPDVVPTDTTAAQGADETAPPADDAKAPEIDADIYAEAERIGLSPDDVRDLGEARTLRLILKASRNQPAQPKAEAKNPGEQAVADQFGIDLSDADDFDPKLVKNLKAMAAKINELAGLKGSVEKFKDYDELREQVTSLSGFVQNAQRAEAERWVDRKFEELGKDWADKFGTGPTGKLDRASAQFKARKALLDDVSVWANGYAARGENPDHDALFNKVLNANHRDHQQTLARRKIEEPLRNQKGQFLTPPRSGKPTPADPKAAQAQKIAEIVGNPDYRYGAD